MFVNQIFTYFANKHTKIHIVRFSSVTRYSFGTEWFELHTEAVNSDLFNFLSGWTYYQNIFSRKGTFDAILVTVKSNGKFCNASGSKVFIDSA